MIKEELYKIGEISKMFGLSVQALRYYEREGLLIPKTKSSESGYRYYTWDQFEKLRLIIYLKGLGLSLKEIKHQLDKQQGKEYIELLESYSAGISERIKSDMMVKQYLDQKIASMKLANDSPQNITLFTRYEELKVLKYDCVASSFHDSELAVIEFIRKYSLKSGINRVGQMFSPGNLENKEGQTVCSGLFVTEEMFTEKTLAYAKDMITTIPGGMYAVMYYRKPTEESLPYIYQLLDEIGRNSYTLSGNIYRMILSDVGRTRSDEDGYLACIRVLVERNSTQGAADVL